MVLSLLLFGLLPIFIGEAPTGGSLMRQIAAPVVGGMITEPLAIFLLLPPLYAWWLRRGTRQSTQGGTESAPNR
jgi:Cu(I)/Ag(I) efflux system membrane protein CusA/SilA